MTSLQLKAIKFAFSIVGFVIVLFTFCVYIKSFTASVLVVLHILASVLFEFLSAPALHITLSTTPVLRNSYTDNKLAK